MRSIRVALAGSIGVALALFALTIGAGMARADTTCYTGCTTTVVPGSTTVVPKVLGTQTGQQPQVQPAVLSSGTAANSTGLAFTGADIAGTVAIGLVAVAGGGLLVRVSRRRRAKS